MNLFLNKAVKHNLTQELLQKYFQIIPSDWEQLFSTTASFILKKLVKKFHKLFINIVSD